MGHEIETLAKFAAGTGWDDMPAAVQRRAKLILLDTIAVMLAGAARPEMSALQAGLAPTAGTGATVFAKGMPAADPRSAAMLNAMSGRSVEMTEGVRGLQSAVHILPATLAIGEQRGASGKQVLEAFVIGYELASRIGLGFTPHRMAHPNGQVSLLGAAAGGARLHGLDGAGISLAIRIATTMMMLPSYNNTVTGATTLNLPAGMGAYAGVLAPEMARAGFFAQEDSVEEALGVMIGTGFDPAPLLPGLGEDWQVLRNYFRFYACCNPIHPALDSLADALAELRPAPGDIERIDVATFAFGSVMRNPAPPNYFASKYSLPHAAAVLITRGGLGFSHLDDSALTDPAIAAIRPLVHMTEDPAMTAKGPNLRPARVTVTLHDGRKASASCENSKRDTLRPDPEPQVREKFAELAATMLTAEGVRAVEASVEHAEDWPSPATLMALLRQHQRG
ncbi:MAG: 2-methylcitrate dehydratase PrpD [Rhodospirillales bacterium]|nr:2-methylcitrate dehydratase PrpD [Rhodospirillales bacterium]